MKSVKFGAVTLAWIAVLAAQSAWGSGTFSGGGALPDSAAYSLGKGIVNGKVGDANCASCHNNSKPFSLGTLSKLQKPVSKIVVDCAAHPNCFEGKITEKQLHALDVYFTKRYRLK